MSLKPASPVNRTSRLGAEALESRLMLSAAPPTVVGLNVASSQWTQDFVDHLESAGLGTAGYSIPVGTAEQLNPLTWENLDTIRITFSEDVDVDRQDLSVTGVVNASYETSGFFYDPETLTASWTLATAIPITEAIHLDLDGDGEFAVVDLAGDALDGEWTDSSSTYSSGDGVAGGDFEFRFNVVLSDLNSNGQVDNFDHFFTRMFEGNEIGDANYLAERDADGDGDIDDDDADRIAAHFGESLPTGDPAGVANDAPNAGDFDLLSIDDRDADYVVSLDAVFDDVEDLDSELTYGVVSYTNSIVLESVTIDASSGTLTVNASDYTAFSGRAEVGVRATDSDGRQVDATLTVDVDYLNQPPVITNFSSYFMDGETWSLSGHVDDPDDDVTGLLVDLSGVVATRAAVDANGDFYLVAIVPTSQWAYEFAIVEDPHKSASEQSKTYVGIT